ncbi:MAG: Cadmium efflux system accessory protein [uncultured Thermomicrobiales bacterium]|uniref:Cadmium efflux system accessory protein n=1 Tax=uncultured Thermomicrobiales bacterium TaxID=1645740 RepID=A0A6J4UJ72_9BACT|nr:MAG: Cadmium efflux system accessory protein [uncultured Thermomicrobiales bacterium]
MALVTAKPDGCDVLCIHPESVRAARATLLPTVEAQDLAAIFSVLADPTRVRIVQALSERELCVCDLANVLGLRQSTVSHQLRLLRALRIVRFRKEGRIAYYALDDAHVAALLAQGLAHVREAAGAAAGGRAVRAGAA